MRLSESDKFALKSSGVRRRVRQNQARIVASTEQMAAHLRAHTEELTVAQLAAVVPEALQQLRIMEANPVILAAALLKLSELVEKLTSERLELADKLFSGGE